VTAGTIQLGELCEFAYGKSLKEEERRPGKVPVYGSNGVVGWHAQAITSGPTIVIGRKGSIGEVNWSSGPCFPIDTTYYVEKTKKPCDLRWLFFVLQELDLTRLNKSAAIPGLNRDDAYEQLVPFPDLYEQQRLAARLEQADRLCRTRRYALELSNTLLPAAFIELFGDPVQNTKGWPVSELEELASVERGKFTPRPRNDPSYYDGRFPFIQTGDISSSQGRLRSWTQTLNERGTEVSRSFPRGTVVIAIVGATIGMTAILEVEVYCPDSVVGIQVNAAKASKEYVEFLLRFWRPVFLAQAPETARANINLDTLRPLRIPLPPLPLQQEFTALVDRTERLRSVQRESSRQAEHLFQTLLHHSFTGEVAPESQPLPATILA
jgi:type I restriction enzyme S subunit